MSVYDESHREAWAFRRGGPEPGLTDYAKIDALALADLRATTARLNARVPDLHASIRALESLSYLTCGTCHGRGWWTEYGEWERCEDCQGTGNATCVHCMEPEASVEGHPDGPLCRSCHDESEEG